jgi:hypothetical protein
MNMKISILKIVNARKSVAKGRGYLIELNVMMGI